MSVQLESQFITQMLEGEDANDAQDIAEFLYVYFQPEELKTYLAKHTDNQMWKEIMENKCLRYIEKQATDSGELLKLDTTYPESVKLIRQSFLKPRSRLVDDPENWNDPAYFDKDLNILWGEYDVHYPHGSMNHKEMRVFLTDVVTHRFALHVQMTLNEEGHPDRTQEMALQLAKKDFVDHFGLTIKVTKDDNNTIEMNDLIVKQLMQLMVKAMDSNLIGFITKSKFVFLWSQFYGKHLADIGHKENPMKMIWNKKEK